MKRYWLFLYDNCYPLGGFCDFKGSFDTIKDCNSKRDKLNIVNGQIFDSSINKVIHQYTKETSFDDVYDIIDEDDDKILFKASYPELQEIFTKEFFET